MAELSVPRKSKTHTNPNSYRIQCSFVKVRAGSLTLNGEGGNFVVALPRGRKVFGKPLSKLRRGDRLNVNFGYRYSDGVMSVEAIEYLGPGSLTQPGGHSKTCPHKGTSGGCRSSR